MKNVDLVIFDCDGVLVDSERITNTVFAEMLNELGLSLTLEDMFEQFVGHSMSYCLELSEKLLQRPVPNNFEKEFHERSAIAYQTSLQPVPGIVDLLQGLEIPYCVASNSTHQEMQVTLGITQLLNYFEGKRFSVADVARGKPYPDVYLYAAKQMSVVPNRCVVIEDTAIGVRAAVSAGMRVFGYAKLTPAHQLEEEGAISFTDMQRFIELLSNLSLS
ncbi:6-phosphogluconate phosphatase [Acaryochloris thomasi RCC1774]|uniref:6-phosphogluconate phosphatase n=1 Tax=Acaryochloris thomasi RCC1774 TaxID=1764569 RepID=A0A2W1JN52_9CYAN|nr:HAD-IA family hydrolase [Acaryochloris thomasi]PZD74763.1 6-phosphogluconate phosphatase [Acaryochloris thomasi RCC1774]